MITGELKRKNQVEKRKIIGNSIQLETGLIKKRKEFRVGLLFMDGLVDKFVDEECNGTFPDVERNGRVRISVIRLF
jgi:hypothetical protein